MRRVAKWQHPAMQRFVVQLLREIRTAAIEPVEFVDACAELQMQFAEHAPHVVQRGKRACIDVLGQRPDQGIEPAACIALRASQVQQRVGERL